jgi:hypothetical protein
MSTPLDRSPNLKPKPATQALGVVGGLIGVLLEHRALVVHLLLRVLALMTLFVGLRRVRAARPPAPPQE